MKFHTVWTAFVNKEENDEVIKNNVGSSRVLCKKIN